LIRATIGKLNATDPNPFREAVVRVGPTPTPGPPGQIRAGDGPRPRLVREQAGLVVDQLQIEDRPEPPRRFGRLAEGFERHPLAIKRLPVPRLLDQKPLGDRQNRLRLAVRQEAIDRRQDPRGLVLVPRDPRPDGLGLGQLTGLEVERRQPRRAFRARGDLDRLLLVSRRALEIPLLLRQVRELRQELRIPSIRRQKPFQLDPSRTEVPRRGMRLRQAKRQLALLVRLAEFTLQPRE
jgi:hypothetical protein